MFLFLPPSLELIGLAAAVLPPRASPDWMKHLVFFPCCPQIKGEEEQRRFDEGSGRYLQNKAKRVTDQEGQQ